jgi:hypothetical protein
MIQNDLGALVEDVTYTQFSGAVEADPAPADDQTSSAITDISTTTLVKGAPSNGVLPLNTPQAIGTGANVTFNQVAFGDAATTRGNLGLGSIAVKNVAAAVADLSQTISNPPTQAEVTNIQNKINELLGQLRNNAISP